jgi:outer membrane protein assembly factor BamB
MSGRDLAQSRYVDSLSDQTAGRVLWSQDLGEFTFSAPVVVDGVVYIGGHFKVLALDSETGRTIWEIKATGPVDSSVAVAGDSLYLGFLDSRLVALNIETGETRWEIKTGGHITSSAVVARGIVYAGSWDGSVYALDAATGEPIWRYETEGRVRLQPTIHEGLLFAASSDSKLHILNARTGQDRLRFRTPKSATASPAVANEMAYLPAAGALYALDTTVKEIPGLYQFKILWALGYVWQLPGVSRPPPQQSSLWRFAPEGSSSSIIAAPAISEDAIFTGDLQGNFYALDPSTGVELWQFRAEGGISTSPVIAGGQVYFGTRDGFLYALNRFDGEVNWRLSLGAAIDISPAYSGGRLYVRTSDGLLHAVE